MLCSTCCRVGERNINRGEKAKGKWSITHQDIRNWTGVPAEIIFFSLFFCVVCYPDLILGFSSNSMEINLMVVKSLLIYLIYFFHLNLSSKQTHSMSSPLQFVHFQNLSTHQDYLLVINNLTIIQLWTVIMHIQQCCYYNASKHFFFSFFPILCWNLAKSISATKQ